MHWKSLNFCLFFPSPSSHYSVWGLCCCSMLIALQVSQPPAVQGGPQHESVFVTSSRELDSTVRPDTRYQAAFMSIARCNVSPAAVTFLFGLRISYISLDIWGVTGCHRYFGFTTVWKLSREREREVNHWGSMVTWWHFRPFPGTWGFARSRRRRGRTSLYFSRIAARMTDDLEHWDHWAGKELAQTHFSSVKMAVFSDKGFGTQAAFGGPFGFGHIQSYPILPRGFVRMVLCCFRLMTHGCSFAMLKLGSHVILWEPLHLG